MTREQHSHKLNVTSLDGETGMEEDGMARDVRAGLSSDPKDLSPWPKYFYDAEGSRLFEQITEQPEYYQTGAELSILRQKAGEIIEVSGCRELVELGSGSASKTRALLDAMFENDGTARYVPLDVSESALRESGERLLAEYPGLEVRGYVGDFDRSLGSVLGGPVEADGTGRRLVIFLGGTIGNFVPEKRRSFLRAVRANLHPGDHLLIGVDLIKDREVLKAAYNDAAGMTARFNKNLLNVFNQRLETRFDPDDFVHRAFYNVDERRVEMWLESQSGQEISVPEIGLEARFGVGEGVRTEISAKFDTESASRMLEEADLTQVALHADDRSLFGLALGAAR